VRPTRLAFVIPWRESGAWLWEYLPDKQYCGDILSVAPQPGSFFDNYGGLPPYLREFWHLNVSHTKLNQYDVVFAWELRTIVAVALWRKMRPNHKSAGFVAVGPILKGPALGILPVLRWLIREADRIVCFSQAECESQAQKLGLPRDLFTFVPTAWHQEKLAPKDDNGYVLALGHSGRDYRTFLNAVRTIDLPVILAIKERTDMGGVAVPPNVTVRYRTEQAETDTLIAGAIMIVIPLRDTDHSAGQSVLLRSMAQGKAIIVTETAGIRDYVQEGETAVLVPPRDTAALKQAILDLGSDPQRRQRMGDTAARIQRQEFSFPQLTERLVKIADEIGISRN
jgi:glycosyltransferase involved in cell wall biosynthesis